jgi:predicted ATP-grasp superfamily ATP-dependent carboligase
VNWADIFERAEAYETDVETIRETLAARRAEQTEKTEQTEEESDA